MFSTPKLATLPGVVDLRETILHWGTLKLTGRLSFLTVKHGGSCGIKLPEGIEKGYLLREEIEEKLHFGVTEDLRLAYERICDVNKALEDSRTE